MEQRGAADNDQLTGEEEFNKGFILPSLIIQLRKILEQYPDDIQILKELIQNADDAGATVVKFLYDSRSYKHDASRLLSPGLSKYQGPALYTYNDAQFNEDDWKGIRMLLQSVKEKDPHKVGFFGMGFKSVFHITDLPSILSGDRLGIIDPLRQFFDATGSHAWNLSQDGPTVFRSANHQTETYIGTFGCQTEHFESGCCPYPGTLFRFPLRTSPSTLSDTVYGSERIRVLLDRFEADAHLNLLFLRNVETIEVYERSSSAKSGSGNTELRYRVSLSDEILKDVRQNRKEFAERIRRSTNRDQMPEKPIISTYRMSVSSTKFYGARVSATEASSSTLSARYLVTNYHCGGPVSAALRKLHRDPELRLLPCVGTAMSLDDVTVSQDGGSLPLTLPYSEGGRVFCFLPLPDDGSTVTGLPVHVNGSFALEANRKHLKWPSTMSTTSGSAPGSALPRADEHLDQRLVWNQCLLREALPYCYAAMLVDAIRLHGVGCSFPVSAIYRAIPKLDGVERRWECILPGLFGELFKQACVFTPVGGGQWIEPRHAVFDTVTESADAEAATIILSVLREAGVRITDAPSHVQLAIRRSCRISPTEISPTVVSAAVRTVQGRSGSGSGEVFRMDWDSKILLLRYFLRRGRCDLLDGLELLPLANGGFETFRYNPRKADRPIFVAPTMDLYRLLIFAPGSRLEDDFLEAELDKDTRKMLLEAIKKGFTQLRLVTGVEFCQLLPRALPKHWTRPSNGPLPQAVEWQPGGDGGQPPVGWLESIWRYLTSEAPDDLGPVDRLPLVPARTLPKTVPSALRKQPVRSVGGRTAVGPPAAPVELVPLYSPTAAACIVRRSDAGMSIGLELETIVAKLGIRVVDALPDYVRGHPLVERKYVFTASYIGVLNALQRQATVDGQRAVVDRFSERLTVSERRKVRELFSKLSEHELDQQHRELLAQLPLFETIENNPTGRRHGTQLTSGFCCAADVTLAAPVERISTSSSPAGGQLPFPVSKKLLDVSTPDALTLARLLGIRRLEPAELLVDVVFGDIQSGFHDDSGIRRVASYVLQHFRRLKESDPRFQPALQTLSFVERRNTATNNVVGTAKSPRCTFLTADRLYDPEDELLRRMFAHDERVYPASAFCDPASLVVLREIGLRRSSCVDPADIIQTAVRITELAAESRVASDRIGEKSVALLEYLQRFPSMLEQPIVTFNGTSSTVADLLANIAWVRRLVNRPATFYPSAIPWYSDVSVTGSGRSMQFHRPSEMMPRRCASTVGSTMPLVAVDQVASVVETAFGWQSPPPVERIVRHLSNVVGAFSGRDKPMYAEISRSIYSELMRHVAPAELSLPDDDPPTNGDEVTAAAVTYVLSLIETADLRSWIWHGDGFTSPDRIVVTVPTFADLRPYVYGLPVELSSFYSPLLSGAGARSTCRLVDVLRLIKTKYDGCGGSSGGHEPILTGAMSSRKIATMNQRSPQHFASSDVRRDLHICVSVLNELKSQIASSCLDTGELETLRQELYLPVHNEDRGSLVMVPLVDCTYCDEEWLQQGYSVSDFGINSDDNAEKIFLVHPNVPTSTSELLGVPTLMSRMLAAEQTLDFGFGQTDSLTGRLKALLNDYSDGLAIPKELIQNADDAGATEVRFLYDERDNMDARTCLLDEGMRECQGPALWVYNDAIFTETDFENITRLGAGTKVSRTDQIGRFGLGFNSVYNVTDVPSFISSHSMVIFDPQTNHLGRCIRDKSRPGVRIDLRRHRRALRRFGNQFKPWDGIFGCDLLRPDAVGMSATSKQTSSVAAAKRSDSYPGTLFRLPLRTATQAARSEICNRPYDDREMKELLRMTVSAAESLLLFAQNVVRIGVYHLPKRSANVNRDVVQIFTAERKLVKVIRELSPAVDLPANASTMVDDETRRLVRNSCLLRSSTLAMSQLRSGADRSQVSTPDCSTVVGIEASFAAKTASTILERSGISRRQLWLICSVMGLGDSLQMALFEDSLIPSAAVAVRLEALGDTYCPIALSDAESPLRVPAGHAFSFLPLPIRTGLPVHVNGSFLVTSSRKHLCEVNEDDKLDPRPAWNRALFRDAVCSSYIRALTDIATLCARSNSNALYELWPNPQFASAACDALVQRFFLNVTSCDSSSAPCLFSDGQRWVSAIDTLFLEGAYASSSVGSKALEAFSQCLSDSSKIVCFLPEWIESSLRVTGAFDSIASSYYSHYRFFAEVFLPRTPDVENDLRNSLVMHALTVGCERMQALLRDSSCIPCSPDGTSTDLPRNLIDPSSVLASMYHPEEGKFPHASFTRSEVINKLRELGMKHDYGSIDWDEVINRAESVSSITEPAILQRFVSGILNVIDYKLLNAEEHPANQEQSVSSYRKQICDVAFFPIMQQPAGFRLPWFGEQAGMVAKPNELHSFHHKDLICCIRPVADVSVMNRALNETSRLETFLQLDKVQRIPCEQDVIQQLEVVVETAKRVDALQECEDFHRILFRVCDYLQNCCSDNLTSRRQIGERLSGLSFILTEANKLVTADRVAFILPYDCSPYLFSLPDNYRRRFGELVTAAGVSQQFTPGAYVGALRMMRDQYGSIPLDGVALPLALRLAAMLNDSMTEASRTMAEVVDAYGVIFIPDSNGVLRSAADLCYNEPDCQWMQASTAESGEEDLHSEDDTSMAFSHPLIPYAMSRQLGVSTRRHDVLQRHSRGLAFGQHERLTARLRRILAAYPCDRELLNEMVQNADDAGSTTIHFIKDPRRHGHERIFDPSWRDIQGPALCIYNDRTFTEQDLTAIQRLGEGRKSTDLNATGQYGVGFNCVYHLTDVPSFLTGGPDQGGTLCIFDPHANMVPGATRDEPGRRFTDITRLRKIFTDVFTGYLEDKGFDISNGTMFRLPLRDENMAGMSELSDQVVTLESIDRLFDRFKPEMFDCLLFLNSVRSIKLSEIDEHSGNLVEKYTVVATLSAEDQQKRDDFVRYAKKVSEDLSNGSLMVSNISNREVVYCVRLSDNHAKFETWLVSQRLGFADNIDVPHTIVDGFRRGELRLMPRGGAAALIESSDSHAIVSRARRISCFLPLPMKLHFPVSINGHFALDHESRRNLWHDDVGGSKTVWNSTLLQSVIALAHVSLLRGICDLFSYRSSGNSCLIGDWNVEQYCYLFPRISRDMTGYLSILAESFYRAVVVSGASLFPVVREIQENMPSAGVAMCPLSKVEWHRLENTTGGCQYFDNLNDTVIDQVIPSATGARRHQLSETPCASPKPANSDSVRRVLLSAGFNLVAFPVEVCESFLFAGAELRYVTPSAVVDFFNGCTCNFLDNSSMNVADTPFSNPSTLKLVLEYCMLDIEYFLNHLEGLPLLLRQDGSVTRFSSLQPIFLSSFHSLFPGLESQFVHSILCDSVFANLEPVDVFQNLDVRSVSELLPRVLSGLVYRYPNTRAIRANEENGPPTGTWLVRLWTFVRLEYEKRLRMSLPTVAVDRVLACDVVEPMSEWCLLPVKLRVTNGQSTNDFERVLVPIGHSRIVFDYSHAGIMSSPICRCLAKLGVAELDCDSLDTNPRNRHSESLAQSPGVVMATTNSSFVRLLVSTLDHPDAVICAISSATTDYSLVTPEDCFCLLRYFADSIEEWRSNEDLRLSLRRVPLFVTVTGYITALTAAKHVYVISDKKFPDCEMENWRNGFGVVFLQHHHSLVQLYEVLGCDQLSVLGFYTDFVFPNFVKLTPESRVSYLEFMRDSCLPRASVENRTVCIAWLRRLEFIPTSNPNEPLRRADAFYDPQHQLLKRMLTASGGLESNSIFPGQPYGDFKWLEFLRIAGLRTEIGADMFEQFARSIADDTARHGPTPSAFERSRTLVTHMFRSKELGSAGFLESLQNIKFIASSQGSAMLQKIHPAFRRTFTDDEGTSVVAPPVFIAFYEGIPEKYEPLCWTSVPLLPDWANPYRFLEQESPHSINWREVGLRLRIHEKPTLEHVVDHVLNLCNTRRSSSIRTTNTVSSQTEDLKSFLLADTMKKIYRYLQSNIFNSGEQELEASDSNELKRSKIIKNLSSTACVVVDQGKTFLRPSQVVISFRNEDQLAPFLYRLPTDLTEFRDLFLLLGATMYATPGQYSEVLASLYGQTEGKRLHPNELRLAIRAMRGVFTSLMKTEEEQPDLNDVSTLYLLSDNGCLTPSHSIAFNDCSAFADRLKHVHYPLMLDLSDCGFKTDNMGAFTEFFQLLPVHHRPKLVSAMVVEVMDERFAETRAPTPVTERLRVQLSSRSFGLGLARLVNHERRQRSSTASGRHFEVSIDEIRRRFERVEVYLVDRVVTYLMDRETRQRIGDSESEAEWFVERRSPAAKIEGDIREIEDIWTIYISKLVIDGEELQTHVADAVCEIANGLLSSVVHYIRPILSCAPHAISRTLDRLRIRPDSGRNGSEVGDRRRAALPPPGSFVPTEEHHLLREDFDDFEPGEYVGYELDENDSGDVSCFETTVVYAIVIRKIGRTHGDDEEISPESTDDETGGSNGKTMSNASAEDDRSTHQRFIDKYLLNIGDDRRPVVAQTVNIYKFHRVMTFLPKNSLSPVRSPLSSDSYSTTNYHFIDHEQRLLDKPGDHSNMQSIAVNTKLQTSNSLAGNLFGAKSNFENSNSFSSQYQQRQLQNGCHDNPLSPSRCAVVKFTFDYGRSKRGSTSSSDTSGVETEPESLDVRVSAALVEVTDALEAAWKLPEPQRRKVIRRLLLRWHPDKNVGDEQLATVVTQHIRSEMERIDANEAWNDGRFTADPRNPFASSESFRRNFAEAYRFFFDQMDERAREQKAQRERYRECFTREFSYGAATASPDTNTPPSPSGRWAAGGFDSRVPPPSFTSCNPQPAQARRFLKQARQDLKSAENDVNCKEPAYEWACFKAYQAVKKALKGALLHVDSSNPIASHEVVILAAGLDDPELTRLARDLDRLVAETGRKLYAPDPIDYAVIPHDEHTAETSLAARDLASAIIGRVGELIESS